MPTVVETDVSTEAPQRLDDILGVCPLSSDALSHVEPDQTPNGFLSRLIQKQLYIDALRFTAYTLPKRDAVWWAALCLWNTQRPKPVEAVDAAFAAVVRWIQTPDEANRRAAEAAAHQAGIQSPIGMLAMAVFFSSGSISLPDCPEVKPDPNATAQQVAAAVVLAAKSAQHGDASPVDAQRRFLVLAAKVAERQLRWQDCDDALPHTATENLI